MGVGDTELIHKDVDPNEIFQRERVWNEEREVAFNLSLLPPLEGGKKGQRREPGKKWPER